MRFFRNAALVLAVAALPSLGQTQSTGSLCVKAHPGRAGVFVDGKYLGPAANFRIARTYSVPAGEHEVKLVDPRFEELVTKATIQPGRKTTLSETLKPLPLAKPPFGVIRVQNADKYAAVYVNDKYFGFVDEFDNGSEGIRISPGDYEVKVVPGGGAPVSQKIRVDANKTTLVK